ncbi:autotransporter assembly complex protein TamA [Cellvibrio sp.]|uniref:autotransporter assembly complex protein TamA n=1 Tax=Cellvibrio sp. TaxID=1965322 RepID=UPI003F4B79CF
MKILDLLTPSPIFAHLFAYLCVLVSALAAAPALAAEPEIKILGGTKSLRENIRQHLTLADESCKTPLWRLHALLGDAENEITQAAQALGFYELQYDPKFVNDKDCWGLELKLTPGAPVLVTELRIEINGEGRGDDIFQSIYDKPGITVGKRLNHGAYESLKTRFGTLASVHGYFDANFEYSQITVNVAEKSAVIALVYNTGPRYRIGAINLQHDILDGNFLRRYLNISEGDYYDSDKLLDLKTLYNASNYFSLASISPEIQSLKDNEVPININLEARKRREYSVGAGVDTNTGPRVLLGFDDRYVNDRGHSVAADLNTGEKKTTALVAYTIPMSRPAYEFLRTYVGYEKEITDTSRIYKNTYGASYTYYQDNKWLQTYALDYQQENSFVGVESENKTDLVIPSVSVTRIKTDGAPYPLAGWTLMAKLSGSPESLGSDFSYLQFNARAKYIKAFSFGRILLRSEIGLTEVSEFSKLPASVRFFAGGDSSVRGYDYQSLGPTEQQVDKNGVSKTVVVGGNNLLVNSIEYDYLFKDTKWAAAVFFDAGNAADDSHIDVKRGAGVGGRWISPIGPIRLDVAKALDGDKGWRLHITMGPDL